MITWDKPNESKSKIEFKNIDVGETFQIVDEREPVFIKLSNGAATAINKNSTPYSAGLEVDFYNDMLVKPKELKISEQ